MYVLRYEVHVTLDLSVTPNCEMSKEKWRKIMFRYDSVQIISSEKMFYGQDTSLNLDYVFFQIFVHNFIWVCVSITSP